MTGENEPLKHPCYDYTLDDALALARSLKHGPFLKHSDPTPAIPEAIGIIRNSLKTCCFNWITGRVALEILRYANGEDVRWY